MVIILIEVSVAICIIILPASVKTGLVINGGLLGPVHVFIEITGQRLAPVYTIM